MSTTMSKAISIGFVGLSALGIWCLALFPEIDRWPFVIFMVANVLGAWHGYRRKEKDWALVTQQIVVFGPSSVLGSIGLTFADIIA